MKVCTYAHEGLWRHALAGAQVNLHFSSGMQALFTVTGAATGQKGFQKSGVTRTFYFQVCLLCAAWPGLKTPASAAAIPSLLEGAAYNALGCRYTCNVCYVHPRPRIQQLIFADT